MTTPLPYQREDVDALHSKEGRALLASDPGLGKTFEFLLWLKEAEAYPALVVCPASLKHQWQEEAWNHQRIKSTILWGETPYGHKELAKAKLIIVNYDILDKWFQTLRRLRLKSICLDEVHLIGNITTKRSRCVTALCKGVSHVIGMSGTPFPNRPWELFPILHILDPETFDSPFSFGTEFCEAEKSFGKWRFSGARNLLTLHKTLKEGVMIRRTKAEVLKDLPPLRRIILPLEMQDREEYDRAERDVVAWLAETDMAAAKRAAKAQRYTRFSYLKKLAAEKKMKGVLEWVENFLQGSGKLLLGTFHHAITNRVFAEFGKYSVVIDGTKNATQRQDAENAFRKGKARILIGQIKAAGVGLNLPEATDVGLIEIPWNPATCQQFGNRAHRLTSTRGVNFWFFVAHESIESKLCKIIQKKQLLMDKILDGVSVQETSLTLFDELQKALTREK